MKYRRKISCVLMIFFIFIGNYCFAVEPNIASNSAILVEESTGKILYEKNAYEKMYPASTTKVMTAILTLENCDLNEMATVSHKAIYSIPNGYVNANLQEGEEISIKDLMYTLMVKSANDAAIVLAEHISGSVEGFADMMNEKAKEIGCQNTHFVNPNGIHSDNHYSTAYDLYLMASYGMKNETFRDYVSTVSYTLPATNQYPTSDRICMTTNDMIRPKSKYYNENVIGIKTGYTTEAKNCLIAGANKNGTQLISVVLHSGTNAEGLSERYIDTNALFDHGFEDFVLTDVVKKDTVIQNIEVENGNKDTRNLELIAKETLPAYIRKETNLEDLLPEIKLNENLLAPITSGATLGTITYTIDGVEYTTELLASHNVEKKLGFEIYILVLGIVLLLIGLVTLKKSCKRRNKSNKNKKKKQTVKI